MQTVYGRILEYIAYKIQLNLSTTQESRQMFAGKQMPKANFWHSKMESILLISKQLEVLLHSYKQAIKCM
jgi:hypothetical protein